MHPMHNLFNKKRPRRQLLKKSANNSNTIAVSIASVFGSSSHADYVVEPSKASFLKENRKTDHPQMSLAVQISCRRVDILLWSTVLHM